MAPGYPSSRKCCYFVDEAGDGTLFDSKGRSIIGTRGCSEFFILGLLEIDTPDRLAAQLETLRTQLIDDPYFQKVPSMQPETRKTRLAFHAKDDVPEVRREVFALLRSQPSLRFFAVVREKRAVLDYVHQRNTQDLAYRYHPNELYDYLVRRLFRDRLHQYDEYDIHFSKRGKADRTAALEAALNSARRRYQQKWNKVTSSAIRIIPAAPTQHAGLQAADYFTWALQRLYELGEDRYTSYLWPAFRLVMDIDDTHEAQYGRYYTQKKPLDRAALGDRLQKK
jgi:hypothetical protein